MENNTETYTSLINKLWELHCLHYLLVWLIYTCYKPIARKNTFYSKQKRSIIKNCLDERVMFRMPAREQQVYAASCDSRREVNPRSGPVTMLLT